MLHLDMHPNDRVVRGYSYGKRDDHFLRWGNRDDGPLELVLDWNADYRIPPPQYIKEALDRESPE